MEIPLEVIHSELDIKNTVNHLGKQVSSYYDGKDLLLVGILNGAFIFLADLSRSISIPHKIDFMGASSYGDEIQSSGNVKITKYPDTSLRGKDILIVEDVIETGLTIEKIRQFFWEEGAGSVKVCSLILKQKPGRKIFEADFVGYREGDKFLIGYGMDYAGFYRNLPYLASMEDPSMLDGNRSLIK